MKNFTKKYQVWIQYPDAPGFYFTEFDTLGECIAADKEGEWYITKWVQLAVSEVGEIPYVPQAPMGSINTDTIILAAGNVDEITDVDKAYERQQLGGSIAKLES